MVFLDNLDVPSRQSLVEALGVRAAAGRVVLTQLSAPGGYSSSPWVSQQLDPAAAPPPEPEACVRCARKPPKPRHLRLGHALEKHPTRSGGWMSVEERQENEPALTKAWEDGSDATKARVCCPTCGQMHGLLHKVEQPPMPGGTVGRRPFKKYCDQCHLAAATWTAGAPPPLGLAPLFARAPWRPQREPPWLVDELHPAGRHEDRPVLEAKIQQVFQEGDFVVVEAERPDQAPHRGVVAAPRDKDGRMAVKLEGLPPTVVVVDGRRVKEPPRRQKQKVPLTKTEQFKQLLIARFGSVLEAWTKALDVTGDGELSRTEFQMAVQAFGYDGDVDALWREMDDDDSGVISLQELDALANTELLLGDYLASSQGGGKQYLTLPAARRRARAVVEQHPELDLERFKRYAELHGYSLSHADSANRALAFVQSHPDLDLGKLEEVHAFCFSTAGLDLDHFAALDCAQGILAKQPQLLVPSWQALARFLRSADGLGAAPRKAASRALAALVERPDLDAGEVAARARALAQEMRPLDPQAAAHAATERVLADELRGKG